MGIVIQMYIDEHNPPHFHADYGEYRAEIDIRTLQMITGNLPPRILRKVLLWASIHQEELLANWNNLRLQKPTTKIEPLSNK